MRARGLENEMKLEMERGKQEQGYKQTIRQDVMK